MRGGESSTSRRRRARTIALYVKSLVGEFRWTLLFLIAAQAVGTTLYVITPHAALGGRAPSLMQAFYGAWMALFAQPILSPPETWYLTLVCAIYPLFGFILVGEGIVRLSLLVISKEQGERKWMKVMASTYRDHVVLCGLGHLGFRILGQLRSAGVAVVALEKDPNGRVHERGQGHRHPGPGARHEGRRGAHRGGRAARALRSSSPPTTTWPTSRSRSTRGG